MSSQIKAFDRWDVEGIKVDDPGLQPYITLEPRIAPKTGARYAKNRFHKSKIFIVERLINKLMIAGHKSKKHKITSYTLSGKAMQAYKLVKDALLIIEGKTKQNPIEVFVRAVETAAPREEIVGIEYGGTRFPGSLT